MQRPITLRPVRKQTGSLGALLIAALILIGLAVGAIALDFSHMNAVRSELQNATDAGALAGAYDIIGDPDNAEPHALNVTATNTADGRDVSNESTNTEVTAQKFEGGSFTDPSTVTVDAEMTVNHMLAPIFGRRTDNLAVRSIAACHPVVAILDKNQAFPIAVSIDQFPNGAGGHEKRLTQLKTGDDVTIIVRPNGNPGRNAVWTSFNYSSANTNTYVGMMEKVLGMDQTTRESYEVPAIEIGKTEIELDNGLNSGAGIDGRVFSPTIKGKPFITLPLIKGDQYNQSQIVIGFINMKVKQIRTTAGDLTLEGTLIKGIVRGWPGKSETGDGSVDNTVNTLSPAVVKLVNSANPGDY